MELLLTVEQAAEQIQLTPATVREHLRTGQLRGIKRGRSWRVPASALSESVSDRNSSPRLVIEAEVERLWQRLGNPQTHNEALFEIAKAPANVRKIINARSQEIAEAFYASEEGQNELADWRALDGEAFREIATDELKENPKNAR